MFWLTVAVTLLVYHPHVKKPHNETRFIRLAYDTQYTCDMAEARIDVQAITAFTKARSKASRTKERVVRVNSTCSPETDGRPADHGWDTSNRMHRS